MLPTTMPISLEVRPKLQMESELRNCTTCPGAKISFGINKIDNLLDLGGRQTK